MIKSRNKYLTILITILICMVALLSYKFGINYVLAEAPNSTNVLTDLQQDSNFKVSDYPDKADDYSIQVIQIAESTAKELLIYTYQPCQRTTYLLATCVNMSLSESVDDTTIYNLELLSSEGVFAKYKVKNVVVNTSKDCRYYNITSIYRPWNLDIDKGSSNNNTINGVAFEVGKLYISKEVDGKTIYGYKVKTTIEIINPYVGFLQYSNGFNLYLSSCRSHYIAFDTDMPIDTLYEANVYYEKQEMKHYNKITGKYDVELIDKEPISITKKVTYDQNGGSAADGLFAKTYTWKRIEKSQDFINDPQNDLKEDVKSQVNNTKWVLRFIETDYKYAPAINTGFTSVERFTEISNVSILRLKFETGGQDYDLGVVSNKITGSNTDQDNNNTNETDPLSWWKKLLAWLNKHGIPVWAFFLVVVIIILVILSPLCLIPSVLKVVKSIFTGIGKCIKWIFNALVWIITLPIKGIMWLINKIKGGG